MKTVADLLRDKGGEVFSVSSDVSVFDAIKEMAEKQVGSLVVMERDKLVGILTERHYARRVVLEGKSSPDIPVRDIMETRVVCVSPDKTIEECMAIMTDKRVRHLPVLDHKRLVGVVSIGDLVKCIIADQRFTIEQLEHYIHG